MQSTESAWINLPMVVIGYEDIYDSTMKTVVAIRMWHFVFDAKHSTSELARKLMDENFSELGHSGAAHQQNSLRKQTIVASAKATRSLIGTALESAQLETAAGMAYRHIINESVFKNLLPHYAGRSDKGDGLSPIDVQGLPRGVLNRRFHAHANFGSDHPLALEWTFNAKRPDALKAGLVHLDGNPMDVHPDQIDVQKYFDMSVPQARSNVLGDKHTFRLPDWIASEDASTGGRTGFYFQTDPNQTNIFDMTLPHALLGAIKPGKTLLKLFKEQLLKDGNKCQFAEDSPALLNLFNNTMTGRDQWQADAINAMSDSLMGFDTFDCTAEMRDMARKAKRSAVKGGFLGIYGDKDGDEYVIEPRQVLKENIFTTVNVHAKVIAPWVAESNKELDTIEDDIRSRNNFEHSNTELEEFPEGVELLQKKLKFHETYHEATKELVTLHIRKIERSFTSKFDSQTIPVGYRAVFDGLQRELKDMPNQTANVALANDMQLTDSDRTVHGHLMNWIGTFFEDDCYGTPDSTFRLRILTPTSWLHLLRCIAVDGRSWTLMQELFFHWCVPRARATASRCTQGVFAVCLRAASSSSTSKRCC